MHPPLQPKSTRGISLVELIISASLITVTFTAFIGLFLRQSEATRVAQLESTAAKLAANTFELIKNKKDNHVRCVETAACTAITDWKTNLTRGSGLSGGGPFTFEVDETAVDQLLPDGRLAQVSGSPSTVCRATGDPRFAGRYRPCAPGDEPVRGNFTRVLTIEEVREDIIAVEITVTWGNGRSETFEGILANDAT